MENFIFTWPYSVWTQFIYASILGPIFNCDYLNKKCITFPWPRHRITSQETSGLLLALTQSEKQMIHLSQNIHRHPPTIACFVVWSLLKQVKSDCVSHGNRFWKAGFRPTQCCYHKENRSIRDTPPLRYISTNMWKQQLLKQLWHHPTCLSKQGPSLFPLNTDIPSFFLCKGSTAAASLFYTEPARQEVPLQSTHSLEFNSFCCSFPLILYSPELPNATKVFPLQQPFFKCT